MTTLVSLAAKAHVGTKTGVVKESVEGMSESAVGCVVHSPTPAGAVVLEDLAMTVNEDRDSKMHVTMKANKVKISVKRDLITYIKSRPELEFKIN